MKYADKSNTNNEGLAHNVFNTSTDRYTNMLVSFSHASRLNSLSGCHLSISLLN